MFSFSSKRWTVLSIGVILLALSVVNQARILASLRELHVKADRASVSIVWQG